MNLQELRELLGAVQIGQIFLENTGFSNLEAFPGNVLCCWRGMPAMKKYKTVKEVCALTGLTRKHLYYFHHEKVVRAAAYANYSVEGYNGYKLYDDTAVEKLHQIALYYQLGLRRDEIRDMMLTPDYDSNVTLHTLLNVEREKSVHIERRIAALEYLMLVGTRNGASGFLHGLSLDDLGRTLLEIREASAQERSRYEMPQEQAEAFAEEFTALISEFARMDSAGLNATAGASMIREMVDLSGKYLGADNSPFLLGLFMSVLGEGYAARNIAAQLTPAHGRAVLQYMIDHPQLYGHPPHRENGENSDKTGRN